METLKAILTKYIRVNRDISELNSQVSELRDNRRTVELDLAALYARAELPDQILLRESEMTFNVKRPNKWKKGWSLSKKDLEIYLKDILGERGSDVMREIVRRHEPKLMADDFGFELKSTGSSGSSDPTDG
jgi:ABC-type phosphate transport system auxiliary subunit